MEPASPLTAGSAVPVSGKTPVRSEITQTHESQPDCHHHLLYASHLRRKIPESHQLINVIFIKESFIYKFFKCPQSGRGKRSNSWVSHSEFSKQPFGKETLFYSILWLVKMLKAICNKSSYNFAILANWVPVTGREILTGRSPLKGGEASLLLSWWEKRLCLVTVLGWFNQCLHILYRFTSIRNCQYIEP